ncbi:MAG: twin-arginine translocase TatA/TatE family subunit [Treponema sp.]|jgi:sec-independent protein translocase protein TatA|nr:twin-arginine translocase TatA/TatE family subunit [Treponema sp.]
MRLGITEIILIVIVAFVLFGGAAKLSGLGKALGKSIREFREELKDGTAETGKKTDDGSGG